MAFVRILLTGIFLALIAGQELVSGRILVPPGPPFVARAPAPDKPNVGPLLIRLSPSSRLNGIPGEIVNVEFRLSNYGLGNYFAIIVKENSPGRSNDQVNFPGSLNPFVYSLSQDQIYVPQNDTQNIIVSMRIPENSRIGDSKLITLEVQPYVSSG